MGDKHPPIKIVGVNTLLYSIINNTDPLLVKICHYVLVTPLLHLPMLEKGIIELRNGNICVRQKLSDLLKVPLRDDVVEADGGAFLGGNGVLQK